MIVETGAIMESDRLKFPIDYSGVARAQHFALRNQRFPVGAGLLATYRDRWTLCSNRPANI